MTRTLVELAEIAASCTKCRLAAGRTQVVFGSGPPDANLMFIGEAPGFHEDKQGVPFVGAAGQLLNELLGSIGLARDDVSVVNVIKCLRYRTPVQLANGSWERLGKLVTGRYDGAVMSVDADGRLVPRRVVGWYRSPLGDRRVYELSYRSAKHSGQRQLSIQLTGEHEVLTERGFVAVEDLKLGDRIATGQGLSDVAFDVVCGSLLGDGSLRRNSPHLSFSHSANQRQYALYKTQWLTELQPHVEERQTTAVSGGRRYDVVFVRTRAFRALKTLREDFYSDVKHVPLWIPERLNPRMLAVWFMDDGYLRIRPPRQPRAEIATVCFSDEDLARLTQGLGRLGIDSYALRGRIHFSVSATKCLSKLIAPYVPPGMRHKLHPDVEQEIPFDPERFRSGPVAVLYDEVEATEITDLKGIEKTFYCIDVEGTHNFVTSGGVVHNCRPPGNRDPLPDEIESCKPYLLEQIDLINPRVLCTLGNFSTQLLLARKVGISRVRGQRSEYRERILIPTFHPAAVLHGGGRASEQMHLLEQDFKLIRTILDEAPEAAEPADPAEQLGLF